MTTPFPEAREYTIPLRPRVLFYSHDSIGLGHIRRTLAIAGQLARRRSDATLLVLTGAFETGSFPLPPNLDLIKLPAYIRHHLYGDLYVEHSRARTQSGIAPFRDALIQEVARTFAPHVVLVDAAPNGPNHELLGTLELLHQRSPRPRLIVGLRDITSDAQTTRRMWGIDGIYDLLERSYDQILIYGSQEIFDPIQEYGFSPALAAKTTFTGYLAKEEPLVSADVVRRWLGLDGRRLVVVTAGGGFDAELLIPAYLEAMRRPPVDDLVSFVVTGPYLSHERQQEIEAAASGLENLTLVPFTPDFLSYLNAADLVVTMAGYNSICEVVSLGKRAIVVPRVRRRERTEQQIRAERFAERGAVAMLRPDELAPERLRALIDELLAAAPPVNDIDFGGLERVGAILAEAIA